ncbi:MAG TPA: response regulator [Planctomycetota bacterium]|nr:response regulator [Planctomycetota bacterium]
MDKKRLLIIDDDAVVRHVVTYMAGSEYAAVAASSRDEALTLLKESFDIVLMDCSVPGMPAETFLLELRSRSPGTQVILMSGYFDSQAATRLGVKFFLAKPFSGPELLTALQCVWPYTAAS